MATPVRVREDRLRPITLQPSAGERRLRRLAVVIGVLGVAQAVAVAVTAPDVALPVTVTTPLGRLGTEPVADRVAALPVGALAAAVLAGPAIAGLVLASPWGFPAYVRALRRDGHHPLPGALGGPLLVGAAALRSGAGDLAAVLALTACAVVAASASPRRSVSAPAVAVGVRSRTARRWALPALPWAVLALHLVAAGGPPPPVGGGVALVAVGAATAVGSVGADAVRARGRGDDRLEVASSTARLVAGSAAGWLLVTASGSP